MRTVTIPYELAERLADLHMLEPYPPAAYEELRELMDAPQPEASAIARALQSCDWTGVPIGNKAVLAAAITELERPKRRLEIEGSPSDGYDAWFTDSDGNLNTVVCFANPMATADWCERNGFAWEVIGLEGDPAQWLAEWRAQQ